MNLKSSGCLFSFLKSNLCSEDSVKKSLWRHPFDRQHGLSALAIVVGPIDVPGHAKVSNFHHAAGPLGRQQTVPAVSFSQNVCIGRKEAIKIPRGNIPMDEMVFLQISAALRLKRRSKMIVKLKTAKSRKASNKLRKTFNV